MIYKDIYIDSSFNKIVGLQLKKIREDNNVSLEELSNKLNNKLSRQTLSTYETGRSKIKVSVFIDICNALGYSPDEVFEEINIRYLKSAKL